MKHYSKEIEKNMCELYNLLDEKQKRFFIATETKKLGHGGQTYLASFLNCCRRTIYTAVKDLEKSNFPTHRIRKKGGGRKPYYLSYPKIDERFEKCIANYTAGDPMKSNIRWTNISKNEIIKCLRKKKIFVSEFVVRKLLKKHGFVKRKNQKKNL